MDGLIQRKSGGQPFNQNARKHGFYSKFLSSLEKRDLTFAAGVDGLDQEIAVLRLKFRSLLACEDVSMRLVNQTAETLGRLYSIKYGLSKHDGSQLKEAVAAVLEEFVIPQPPASESAAPGPSVPASPPPGPAFPEASAREASVPPTPGSGLVP